MEPKHGEEFGGEFCAVTGKLWASGNGPVPPWVVRSVVFMSSVALRAAGDGTPYKCVLLPQADAYLSRCRRMNVEDDDDRDHGDDKDVVLFDEIALPPSLLTIG